MGAIAATEPATGAMLRESFRRRARHAVERAADAASPEALMAALGAPTDAGALARILAGQSGAVAELEPYADAIARGAVSRESLAQRSGGLLSGAQIGQALGGISRQAVDKRRRAGKLLAVPVGSDWRYPAIQLCPDGNVPEILPQVIAAMSEAGPWATLDFLLTADPVLGGATPIACLHAGGKAADTVRRLVGGYENDAFS